MEGSGPRDDPLSVVLKRTPETQGKILKEMASSLSRQEVERYLYFLEEQREAAGFGFHPDFREFYPIPVVDSHGVREDSHP